VPGNLCVKLPDGLSDREGAFVTLGAIALQGVRVADLRLGEVVGVLGLGLLGQITVQLLRASGCRVLALDLDEARVALARTAGAGVGGVIGRDDANALANEMTGGQGLDAVIVTAATTSSAPIVLAGDLLRKKGRVSVVGAVGMAGYLVVMRAANGANGASYLIAAGIITALAALANGANPAALQGESILFMALLGCIVVPGSSLCIARAPRYLPAAQTGLVLLLEILLGPWFIYLFLGESPSDNDIAGGALVLATLIAHTLWESTRPNKEST